MSRDIAPFGLRMPPALKAQLEEAAKAAGRSLNAEIVARLEASVPANVEDEVRASRESDLSKLRASHQRALWELSEYRERLRAGDTAPYGADWLREVIAQCEYRAERLERMIYRAERELEALETDSLPANSFDRAVAQFEARITEVKRRVAAVKAQQSAIKSSQERALVQENIDAVEATIAQWESELERMKEQAAKEPSPTLRAAEELRRTIEQSNT